jgi:3-hydroxybutyryl-CoA dehydratase
MTTTDDLEPAALGFAELLEGTTATRRYVIDDACYRAFLSLSGDRSPVHVDEVYARDRGFAGRVMHGAILNAFVSHMVGMVLPGRLALLLSVELRYLRPSYLGDTVELVARVSQVVDSQQVVVLALRFHNVTQGALAASGRAQVAVRNG